LITGPNAPAINNKGDVAFRANLGDSYPYTNAILIRTAGAVSVERVALVGDPVAGSTISALSIPPLRLNKFRKVAYVCTLADGRSAIVLDSTAAAEAVAITETPRRAAAASSVSITRACS